MKAYILNIFLSACLILAAVNSYGQRSISPVEEYFDPLELKSMSLAQSSAAISGGHAFHENPAVPLPEGEIRISGLPFNNELFYPPYLYNDLMQNKIFNLSAGYAYKRFSISANFSRSDVVRRTFRTDYYKNDLKRIHVSYRINDNFSAGIGYSHISYNSTDNLVDSSSDYTITASGYSAGFYYTNNIQQERLVLTPEAGLSINNLSSGFKMDDYLGAMPSVVRLNGSIRTSSPVMKNGLHKFGVGLFAGLTKYLPRREYNPDIDEYSTKIGFSSLFRNWDSYIHRSFTGNLKEVSALDQIAISTGAEIHLLETLYLRAGQMRDAYRFIKPYSSIGAEIDLYYISIGVVRLIPVERDPLEDGEAINRVQISLRIPVDGKPRPSLLRRLF